MRKTKRVAFVLRNNAFHAQVTVFWNLIAYKIVQTGSCVTISCPESQQNFCEKVGFPGMNWEMLFLLHLKVNKLASAFGKSSSYNISWTHMLLHWMYTILKKITFLSQRLRSYSENNLVDTFCPYCELLSWSRSLKIEITCNLSQSFLTTCEYWINCWVS
jgi:hypothetical protein